MFIHGFNFRFIVFQIPHTGRPIMRGFETFGDAMAEANKNLQIYATTELLREGEVIYKSRTKTVLSPVPKEAGA